jgi:hypothetical protein
MEGALEGDDPEALRGAVDVMIAARRLDGGLDRLGAGIGEEGRHQTPPELRLAGNLEDVGDVPEFFRLRLERLDEMGMRMAEDVDGDATHEIQVAGPIGRRQPGAVAALESEVGARIGREQWRIGIGLGGHRGSRAGKSKGRPWAAAETPTHITAHANRAISARRLPAGRDCDIRDSLFPFRQESGWKSSGDSCR